jgi:hypothetical protein
MYEKQDQSDSSEQNSMSLRFQEIEQERVVRPSKSSKAFGSKQGGGISQAINAAQFAHQSSYSEPTGNMDNRSYGAMFSHDIQPIQQAPQQEEYHRPESSFQSSRRGNYIRNNL